MGLSCPFKHSILLRLVKLAKPLKVTFHRAFDMTRDPVEALEDLISIGGIERILTSGQESSVLEGLPLLEKLAQVARGRILILPGGESVS